MSSSDEDEMMDNADLEGDLFGGSDDETPVEKTRELDDDELDSGDDEGRQDRLPDDGHDEDIDYNTGREANIQESIIYRHPLPKPVDGEVSFFSAGSSTMLTLVQLNALRLPKFLGIDPISYESSKFEMPVSDHHTTSKSPNFSACATASSTMRYRKDQSSGKLESNTVVYKWSDGSTTISVGEQHFELQTKPLAPPRDSKTYQEVQDSHSYFASPSVNSQLLVMVGHMINQYTVRPNKDIEDDALEKLQKSLAAATRGVGAKGDDKNGPELITNTQDPELQKKRAEIAEKERMRAQRRRDTAAERANLNRSGGRGLGGLNLDDLEGRAGRRIPGSGRKPSAKRPRHRPDYDSDDDLPRGRTREDEYDKEDGFLASSDEDLEEEVADDDEEEEMLDDDSDEPKAKKQKSSKPDEGTDEDADAEADLDDVDPPAAPAAGEPAAGRGRKRNVIEDDEEDE